MPTLSQKSSSAPSTSPPVEAGATTCSPNVSSTSPPSASTSSPSTSSTPISSGSSISSGSGLGPSSSAAALSDAALSTSGTVMTSSMASTTLSQLRPMTVPISAQRLRPLLPLKLSMPAPSEPRIGLPLKNFVTAGSSQTDPTDDT